MATGAVGLLLLVQAGPAEVRAQTAPQTDRGDRGGPSFQTSYECVACHNGLTTPTGENVSIGVNWRASMMAQSARDPYWQGAVRRETIDHPMHTAAIEDESRVVGTLPEQVPYLEWQHSAFREDQSCQACHMPAVTEPTPITSVVGEPRERLGRHTFLGGNFFMLRMLNRYRADLGVTVPPQELEAAARATERQLQTDTASVDITTTARTAAGIEFAVSVTSGVGHKLPTGYPSRRVWLHVTIRDASGRTVFESGAVAPDGAIAGNDNDADATVYERHYQEIRAADEVQIYESVMTDADGVVTTGLLRGARYVKDNRLLPRGFDKTTASDDIAVRGRADADPDFLAGGDRVRYVVDSPDAAGSLMIEAELRYQPIGYRWAQNLGEYDAVETKRFVSYYDATAAGSSLVLAHSSALVE